MYYIKKVKLVVFVITFFMACLECGTTYGQIDQGKDLTMSLDNDKIKIDLKVYLGDVEEERLKYTLYSQVDKGQEDIDMWNDVFKNCREQFEDYISPVVNKAKVINIIVNKARNQVIVDMSEDYSEMNLGHMGEYLALKSLAYTLGDYYDVEEVFITLEGKPYSSGHYYFEEGEGWWLEDKEKSQPMKESKEGD